MLCDRVADREKALVQNRIRVLIVAVHQKESARSEMHPREHHNKTRAHVEASLREALILVQQCDRSVRAAKPQNSESANSKNHKCVDSKETW